ncbi:MAG: hypothetical protein JNK57_16645 [Planctomycetaceae bacterium]|nr:hypothetical protein [Planctomycetaceae bacterium]
MKDLSVDGIWMNVDSILEEFEAIRQGEVRTPAVVVLLQYCSLQGGRRHLP